MSIVICFQVIRVKVHNKHAEALTDVCHNVISNIHKKNDVKDVCKTFVRKYMHARVGGHIRGMAERVAEKKGVRTKGGCSLRDKLYNVTGNKKDTKNKQSTK